MNDATSDEQLKRRELIATFCGYGNPEKANLFFMGIEEHDVVEDDSSANSLNNFMARLGLSKKKQYTWLDADWSNNKISLEAKGKTERTQLDIYTALYPNALSEDEIFKTKIHSFNFYPLGSPKQNVFPPHYAKLFGFPSKLDMYNYFEHKRSETLGAFVEEYIRSKKKILIVFGATCWDKAKLVFPDTKFTRFGNWKHKNGGRPSAIEWSEDKTIWLTGHPSYGWLNEEVIRKIGEEMKVR